MSDRFKLAKSVLVNFSGNQKSIRINMLNLSFYIFLPFLTSRCSIENEKHADANILVMNNLEWSLITGKKVFFGHQSVGNGVIKGIDSLQSTGTTSTINIVLTRDTSDFNGPIFAHSKIGKNLDPKSKIDDFVNILESGVGSAVDIAMMKLCYVDIDKNTDIKELFNYYQNSVNRMKSRFPDLNIIHWTVPLTEKPKGIKGVAKTILRMDDNVYRNRYNQLLRQSYSKEDIFDIAAIESTFDDGTQNLYKKAIPGLISDYSSDGSHLNELGRKVVAQHLLRILQVVN